MSKKLRPSSKNQKRKKENVYLAYGNPDACATIRLLPPSLDEQTFLSQAYEHSEALKNGSGYREFNYQMGTRDVKLFEKPLFSVAYFEFSSVGQATKVREQLSLKIFHEPQTEDNMLCQVVKPVLGMVYSNPVARDGNVDHGSTFKSFCSLREETGKKVLLRSIIDELKAKKKKKKRKKVVKLTVEGQEHAPEIHETGKKEDAPKSSALKKKKKSKKKASGPTAPEAGTSGTDGGAESVAKTELSKKSKRKSKSSKTKESNDPDHNKKDPGSVSGAAGQAASLEHQPSTKPKRKRNRKPKDTSKASTEQPSTAQQ